jgi:clan AA aspartic protease (TIGR02281 family)
MLPLIPIVLFISPNDLVTIPTAPQVVTQAVMPQQCSMPSADMWQAAFSRNTQTPARSGTIRITPARSEVTHPKQDIWRADDGLFYVDAEINGAQIRLLVDTGASMIVLTPADARRVGAAPEAANYTLGAETAAGKSKMAKVTLANMKVGATAAESVPAAVGQEGLGVSLLGQNWLSHLGSVTIEGDRMILN